MAPETDSARYEELINEMFCNLTMFVRDTDLSPEQAEKYTPGRIIMEPGYTDASCRVGGIVTSHRFAILSSHMANFCQFEDGTQRGLFVARHNAHFKIMDVYEYRGKTQILLLHLPDDRRWKLFEDTELPVEAQLIEDARKQFEERSLQDPIPELTEEDWLARCASLPGIDDSGNYYGLEPVLESELHSVKDAGFREFYHKFVYIECSGDLRQQLGDLLNDEDAGIAAYGYIDEAEGLLLRVISPAYIRDNHVIIRGSAQDEENGSAGSGGSTSAEGAAAAPGGNTVPDLRAGGLGDARFLDLSQTEADLSAFAASEQAIRGRYDTKNSGTEQLRSMAFLDPCRDPAHPDDMNVMLLVGNDPPEQVRVRGNYFKDNEIRGELLDEPAADFGVHKGDSIRVFPFRQSDGSLICMSPQRR